MAGDGGSNSAQMHRAMNAVLERVAARAEARAATLVDLRSFVTAAMGGTLEPWQAEVLEKIQASIDARKTSN